MQDEHDTNLGWWTEKPERESRPSSYVPLSGGATATRRPKRIWLKAAMALALALSLGWSLMRLVAN